jgi:hypothetical protein
MTFLKNIECPRCRKLCLGVVVSSGIVPALSVDLQAEIEKEII